MQSAVYIVIFGPLALGITVVKTTFPILVEYNTAYIQRLGMPSRSIDPKLNLHNLMTPHDCLMAESSIQILSILQ